MQRSRAATTGAEQEDNDRGPQRTPSRHQRVMEADPPHRRDRQHQWTSPHPEESSKIPGRQRRCRRTSSAERRGRRPAEAAAEEEPRTRSPRQASAQCLDPPHHCITKLRRLISLQAYTRGQVKPHWFNSQAMAIAQAEAHGVLTHEQP